ncbi:DUF6029 family protein [Ferruginibacter yonginensis]|uniref:DUF6029 family protein n=1 Tax=Ferruginibacter yonginensis TaxID=1310416 RepID=A0ABV8QNT4_9BACT
MLSKYTLLTFLCSITFSNTLLAQLSGGFENNSAWYIDDDKVKLESFETANRVRANAYLRLDYTLKNFTAGVQVESYVPKALLNYSPNFKDAGLGNYYLNYKNDSIGVDITVGHFYEQFGSGLVLRTWEDRQLGIANSIVGGKIKYQPTPYINVTALYGKQRNGLAFDYTNGTIAGFNGELLLSNLFRSKKATYNIGGSYVNRYEKLPTNTAVNNSTYLTSIRGSYAIKGFTIDAEYAFKSADALVEFGNIRNDLQFDGDAYLLNIGYSKKGLGINATFRRLENFGLYSQRNLQGNAFNEGFVNFTPSLTKQYDYSLTNIYVYAAQPNISFEPNRNKAGEIGGQFDIFYKFKKDSDLGGKYGTNLAINVAQWHGLKGRYDALNRKYKADLAGVGQKYYHEASIEIRKQLTKNWTTVFTYLNQYYNNRYVEETVGDVNAQTVVLDNTFKFKKGRSIRWEVQHQWANASFKNWAAMVLEYNFNSQWSIFGVDLYNYGNDDVNKQIHFYNAGVVFKKNAIRAQTSYGRQRGGLICVGGVCRFVPESAGLNLSINYSF